jgi:translation elongation factor EF-4
MKMPKLDHKIVWVECNETAPKEYVERMLSNSVDHQEFPISITAIKGNRLIAREFAAKSVLKKCRLVVLYVDHGISKTMHTLQELAKELKIKVELRTLGPAEEDLDSVSHSDVI